MADLFDQDPLNNQSNGPSGPLANRLRPTSLDDVVGQDHLLGPDGTLRLILRSEVDSSIIFWGPPGVGKTTIARLLADHTGKKFVQISAIFSNVAELKKVFEAAKLRRQNGMGTLLFVDEIHRFNKSQQDSFLPLMEDGTITLIGATTENPSFELNAALLSRAEVLVLNRLTPVDLEKLAQRVEVETQEKLPLDGEAREFLIDAADGDGRMFLNLADRAIAGANGRVLNLQEASKLLSRRAAQYDKGGDAHYNLISALHKSVRGSDPDAALYWFCRMLEGGDDPRYLARRITRMAVEDIGLADPTAQNICLQSWQTYERLGSPEGELALAQAVIYLALAPKSAAGYAAYRNARSMASKTGSEMPPKHILNAPTKLMKEIGYGDGYDYDHSHEDGFSGQNYWPDAIKAQAFYQPVERGFERELSKRLSFFVKKRAEKNAKG